MSRYLLLGKGPFSLSRQRYYRSDFWRQIEMQLKEEKKYLQANSQQNGAEHAANPVENYGSVEMRETRIFEDWVDTMIKKLKIEPSRG